VCNPIDDFSNNWSYFLFDQWRDSTYNGAYANDQFREQIKNFEENKLAQAKKAAEKVLEREKVNREMLRGNEVVKKDLMDTYQEHIDARGDVTQDMIEDETEDDGFLHYLAGFSLPELKNLYKAATISAQNPFGRSVPAKTTTKGAVAGLVLKEVKVLFHANK
jgi:hypothetical protein